MEFEYYGLDMNSLNYDKWNYVHSYKWQVEDNAILNDNNGYVKFFMKLIIL